MTRGSPAPAPPRSVQPGAPPSLERDALGNARGGIRTPQVDVPIAVLSGVGQPPGSPCSRFGTTLAFEPRAEGQGFDSILRTTRRQNFLVPPRAHRSFPLSELRS